MNWTTSETRAAEIVRRAEKHKSRKQLREDIEYELSFVQADMQQRCARLAADAGYDDLAAAILNLKIK